MCLKLYYCELWKLFSNMNTHSWEPNLRLEMELKKKFLNMKISIFNVY